MAAKPHNRTREMLKKRGEAAETHKPVVLPDPEPLDERCMRRQTLYLPPGVYEHIRETCFAKRKSQQAFFREVFDFYFREHGSKSWDELAKEMQSNKPSV